MELDEAQARKDEGLMAELVDGFSPALKEQRALMASNGDGGHCSTRRGGYTTREGKLKRARAIGSKGGAHRVVT